MGKQRKSDLRDRMFTFACEVVSLSHRLSTEPGVVRELARQLAAAATSAGANLEEAKAPYSHRDFAAKNSISLKEMREALYWLRVIDRCNLAAGADIQPLLDEANQLTAMLTAGMKRLNPTPEKAGSDQFSVLSSKFLSSKFLQLSAEAV
jgi:four helix bundle protein